ncbi:MAG TPA: N-acetylglucosamine-6-phosphate deacetylase [Pirellulaceae bacterium]|nr:N-acetylglucosamine-6-phosphate deacetylase [Pirellulaceae bacterium]
MSVWFTQGTVILPDRLLENASVEIVGDRITRVTTKAKPPKGATVVDLRGRYLAPGFIDIHVHGGGGADFMDGTDEAVRVACAAHLRHGTTTIYPTTTTGSAEQIHAMLDAVARVRGASGHASSAAAAARGERAASPMLPNIPGVHLYGPYFAESKVGCHSKDGRRSPVADEYQAYFASGLVKVATCAAELPGAEEFYRAARRRRCLITCGHSDASWGEMQRAFDAGMRHVDHFWCAMSSVASVRARLGTPMQASMAEFVLMNGEMSTEVIADGCHLSPELLEFAYRMKGPERLCLVTDCNRALDLPPGKYRFGSESEGTWFESDGKVGWAPNGSLASSIVGMDHMVRHMHSATTADLPATIRMASLTPAERLGIARQTGSIEPGKRADLVVLNRRLEVEQVMVRGQKGDGGHFGGLGAF